MTGDAPQILVRSEKKRRPPLPADPAAGWRWLGWLGLVLAVMGLGDFALAWVPPRLGSPEWEFATVAATFSGLPLVTMGFAGLMGAGLALGARWLIATMSVILLAFSLFLLVAYAVFLMDVPVALRAVSGAAGLAVKKAIAKTSLLGLGFVVTYASGAVAGYRHLKAGAAG